jgi:hypothetical protein
MSFVQAHIDNRKYQVDDRILCYFAFPRIGTTVALWPGDFHLIHRNRTLFLLTVNQETKYFAFLLTSKRGLSVSMIIVTPLYNPAILSDFDLKHPLHLGWRNLSKTAEKSSSSPRAAAGVLGDGHVMCCCVSFLVEAGNSFWCY